MKSEKPITTNDSNYGCDTIVSTHPAFGMIRFGRVNGSKILFGSEVENSGCISVEIKEGEEHWNLHEKHYSSSGKKHLLRLSMSYAQFAEAITCMDRGDGIPCTLEYVMGQQVPQISKNTINVADQIKLDIKGQSKTINGAVEELRAKINSAKLSKKEAGDLLSALDKIGRELNSNLPFIVEQCEEAVEHITTRSKIEVEAFAQGRIRELGIEALADKQLKALENK